MAAWALDFGDAGEIVAKLDELIDKGEEARAKEKTGGYDDRD